jgi:S-adenosyl methyltransferase
VRGTSGSKVSKWWRPAVVAGSTVIGSLVLPLLINLATESEPAAWVRPTVAAVTFVVAMQAVRVEQHRVMASSHQPRQGRSQNATLKSERLRHACTRCEAPGGLWSDTRVGSASQAGGAVTRNERARSWPDDSLIDHGAAQAARVYDYLLGGVDNFEVDRKIAERIYSSAGGVERARLRVRANRRFLGRAVSYLAGEAGIRQFLDLGTGIPNADNVHDVAQATAPDARIVYVDNDPVVLAHAHTLRNSSPLGSTTFVYGDLRDHERILREAAETLDFCEPVAVVMVGVLHHFRDDEHPEAIVRHYLDAVPSGSYLVVENIGKESEDVARLGEIIKNCPDARFTLVPRTRAEMGRFFEGTELVDPGVVFVDYWRPDGPLPTYETRHPCGVGRKP